MKYRKLGNTGLRVSEVSLGSWLTYGSAVERETSKAVIKAAFDAGINVIDTADVYDRGKAEAVLGELLADYARKDYVLASKCYFPMSDGVNDRGLSRKHVLESCNESLIRLNTDYLDLYQCHRWDDETPLEETIQAMDDLCRRGKILYWGVSCWSAEQLARAHEICAHTGWQKPISNQPPYNLFVRGIEDGVIPTSSELGVSQIVYSPLAQGVLSGKYKPGAAVPSGSRASDENRGRFIQRYMGDAHLEAAQQLAALAAEVDAPLAAFALAWCLQQDNVASVIIGASNVEQLEQNVRASQLEVPAELFAKARAIVEALPAIDL